MRERGLKPVLSHAGDLGHVSLPMRERGLKHVERVGAIARIRVAPHAGAWIET